MKTKKVYLILILISVFLSMRGDNTPDTAAYRQIYEQSSLNTKSSAEFLYIVINYFFSKILNLNFDVFLLLLTLILFTSWYKLTSKLTSSLSIAFFSFIPFYGLYFFGITIRSSIAVIISYSAIVYFLQNDGLKRYLLYYLLIILASSFHMSATIFAMLPLIAQSQYRNVTLYLFLLSTSLLSIYSSSIPLIQDIGFKYLNLLNFNRVQSYLINASQIMSFSMTLLKSIMIGGIFIFLRKNIIAQVNTYNFFLNTYLLGIFLISLFSFVTAGNRLGFMFLFFEFILLTFIYEKSNLQKKITIPFIGIISIINFIQIIQQGNGLVW